MARKRKKRIFSILVVDDDELLLSTLEEILLSEGYKVKTAKDGISAFKKLQGGSFDIVLTDLNMPGMTGLELLEKIYNENIRVTPVLMSAFSTRKIKSRAFQKGAYANLDKPFSIDSLFSVIENSLRNKKTEFSRV